MRMGETAPARDDHALAQGAVRVIVRPIATPLSLGFVGLSGATLAVAGLELGWVAPSQRATVGLVVMTFTVVSQLIATVYGFLARDAVAATGMGVLAGTWLAVGSVLFTAPGRSTSGALGLVLLASAAALLAPAAAGLRSKALATAVLVVASARFAATGTYELTAASAWKVAAGWIGVALCGLATFAAAAFEIESARRRRLPVTLRRGRGSDALVEDFTGELAGVRHEAGVREQL